MKFVTVVFVYKFVTFCSCNIVSVSWYLLVLLIRINYQDTTLNKIYYYFYYYFSVTMIDVANGKDISCGPVPIDLRTDSGPQFGGWGGH